MGTGSAQQTQASAQSFAAALAGGSSSDATTSGKKEPADASALTAFGALTGTGASDGATADLPVLQQGHISALESTPIRAHPTATTDSDAAPAMMGVSTHPPSSVGIDRAITVAVTDRNWPSAVATQVQWLVNSHVQSATLQLSPEHLGPLEVHIDMQSSQVNVSFTATHSDTRSALEQSMPRLREILANGGLTLGQTSVQQEARSGSSFTPQASRAPPTSLQTVDSVSVSHMRSIGLLDEYA
jgi:flagellar hook-length control protein FliK